jgi:uncharacterized membrane protein
MSDISSPNTTSPVATKWWDRPKLLRSMLIASLALNVLVASAVVTRVIRGERMERMPGASQIQLVPRKFLRDLPSEKRKVAREILRRYAAEQRGDRQWVRELSLKLADAITAQPYDPAKVKLVLGDYASRSGAVANRGGDAAMELLAILTPDERTALATAIRERAAAGR